MMKHVIYISVEQEELTFFVTCLLNGVYSPCHCILHGFILSLVKVGFLSHSIFLPNSNR